jgi:endonuclease YncB( thermonuclease family)
MKKFVNSVIPFLVVSGLIFKYWLDSQPTTAYVEVPGNPEVIYDPAANLPEFNVVPGSVYDGDTIRVVPVGIDGYPKAQQLKVRFACIDAPERDQPGGIEARDGLKKMLVDSNNRVKLNIITTDRYGRSVAEVWNSGGLVQGRLVHLGLAYPYEQYSSDCPNWDIVERAEKYAVDNRLGVWNDPSAVKPWEYRRK